MDSLLKHLASLLLVILSVCASQLAFAKPANAQELPHFFPKGITTTQVPSEQWPRYLEYLRATSACLVPTENTPPATSHGTMKVTRKIHGKEVTFHFDAWRREADGRIYYSDLCGRTLVTEKEFKVASEYLMQRYAEGTLASYMYHKDIEERIIQDIATTEKKTPEVVRKELAKPVPELAHLSPPVSFREFQQIPEPLSVQDFVQTEVHYAHAQFFGAVWLNTELVYLTIQGAIVDKLVGKPTVIIHEMVHGSPLQDLIFSEALDMELMASIPMMLIPDDQMSLLFHHYAKDWREMVYVISGFNFAQARKEIILFNLEGSLRIDAAKLDEYARKLDVVKAALLEHYHKVLPELYRNKFFWASINNKFVDSRAVFRILLMKDFDPTILGGHAATMKWNDEHKEEIRAIGLEAFKTSNVGKDAQASDEANLKGQKYSRSSLLLLMRLMKLDDDTLQKLARKYNLNVAGLATQSPEEVFAILLPILLKESKSLTVKE